MSLNQLLTIKILRNELAEIKHALSAKRIKRRALSLHINNKKRVMKLDAAGLNALHEQLEIIINDIEVLLNDRDNIKRQLTDLSPPIKTVYYLRADNIYYRYRLAHKFKRDLKTGIVTGTRIKTPEPTPRIFDWGNIKTKRFI